MINNTVGKIRLRINWCNSAKFELRRLQWEDQDILKAIHGTFDNYRSAMLTEQFPKLTGKEKLENLKSFLNNQHKYITMDFSELKKHKTILVKPEGLDNYYLMNITSTDEGFTVSNYGDNNLTEHEYLFKVNTQNDLDKLDYIRY